MEKQLREFPPFQRQVSFTITERCNLQCKHCVVSAGSGGADMAPADLCQWLDEAAAIGRVKEVCMTGGEPFLVYNTLQEAIDYATSLGLKTAVVTNGYWASSMARAVRVLEGLSSLSNLTLSFDQFHRQFLPIGTIKIAILAAREVGIDTDVRVCYLTDEQGEVAEAKRLLGDALDLEGVRLHTQSILPLGRAASELAGQQFHSFTYDEPCVNANDPFVVPDGWVHACCGPPSNLERSNPLWLGNASERSLTSVLEAAQYNVPVQIIRSKGPYCLWSLVRGEDSDLQRYDTTNKCALCISLMSDPEFVHELEVLVQDPKLRKKVAIERFFLLQEPAMLTGSYNS